MKRLVLLALLALVGCTVADPQSVGLAGQVKVERLGEVDGCLIYRFKDMGYTHYFVRCGNNTTTKYSYKSGKSINFDSISTEGQR
jgi:hypothetical protein